MTGSRGVDIAICPVEFEIGCTGPLSFYLLGLNGSGVLGILVVIVLRLESGFLVCVPQSGFFFGGGEGVYEGGGAGIRVRG